MTYKEPKSSKSTGTLQELYKFLNIPGIRTLAILWKYCGNLIIKGERQRKVFLKL